MMPNENFVTWAWDMRLFTRANTIVYCTRKSLWIYNVILYEVRLGTRLIITEEKSSHKVLCFSLYRDYIACLSRKKGPLK